MGSCFFFKQTLQNTHDFSFFQKKSNWPPGLLLAEAELNSTGLVLPHPFGTLTYETTIFRPRGTGVRRLEGEKVDPPATATEAGATWDPENHPSTLGPKKMGKTVKG